MEENQPRFINEDQLLDRIVEKLNRALTYEGNDRPALVARIPVICNDVRDIKSDLRWIRWLIVSIAGGIGILALHALGLPV